MGLCKDGYYRESERYEGKKYIGVGKTPKDALRDLDKKLTAAKNGETLLNSNTTVRAWSKIWLETYIKNSGIIDATYDNIQGKVDNYIVAKIGDMKMKDVKETHLQKILNEQAGMSMSHCSKLRSYMKRMFHRAYRERMISYDPAADLALPQCEDKKRRSLTDWERYCVLYTAGHHYAGPWVLTLLYCGPRPSETIALQWKDIDFDAKRINITLALESGKDDDFKAPKSAAGVRSVPMPDELVAVLQPLKAGPFDYVFTQVKNKKKHHTHQSLRCYWNNFKRQLDIDMGAEVYRNQITVHEVADDLTPYVLRHTYCTDLQDAGVPINVAKYLMGHSDITTTANIYTHQTEDEIDTAAELYQSSLVKKVVKSEISSSRNA